MTDQNQASVKIFKCIYCGQERVIGKNDGKFTIQGFSEHSKSCTNSSGCHQFNFVRYA